MWPPPIIEARDEIRLVSLTEKARVATTDHMRRGVGITSHSNALVENEGGFPHTSIMRGFRNMREISSVRARRTRGDVVRSRAMAVLCRHVAEVQDDTLGRLESELHRA